MLVIVVLFTTFRFVQGSIFKLWKVRKVRQKIWNYKSFAKNHYKEQQGTNVHFFQCCQQNKVINNSTNVPFIKSTMWSTPQIDHLNAGRTHCKLHKMLIYRDVDDLSMLTALKKWTSFMDSLQPLIINVIKSLRNLNKLQNFGYCSRILANLKLLIIVHEYIHKQKASVLLLPRCRHSNFKMDILIKSKKLKWLSISPYRVASTRLFSINAHCVFVYLRMHVVGRTHTEHQKLRNWKLSCYTRKHYPYYTTVAWPLSCTSSSEKRNIFMRSVMHLWLNCRRSCCCRKKSSFSRIAKTIRSSANTQHSFFFCNG